MSAKSFFPFVDVYEELKMDRIEEVKRILEHYHGDIAFWYAHESMKQIDKYMEGIARQICQLFEPKETDAISYSQGVLDGRKGYVKLAKDQELPLAIRANYKDTQQDMVREGWRKVEVKDGS